MENNIDIVKLMKNVNIKYTPEYFKELSKKQYKEDREYPENFSNWYPHIKDFGQFKTAKVISNQIFTWQEVEAFRETDNIDKVDWNLLNIILRPTLNKMEDNKLYNIKNGCFSNKFDFITCITDKEHLAENLWKINYNSYMFDTGGYTELVVRELIPYNKETTLTIYNGMPLRDELRVFYNMDKKKIEYVVDYWDYEYCYPHIPNEDKESFNKYFNSKDKDERLIYMIDYVYQYIDTLKFDNTLKGIWSIDFMWCKDYKDNYDGIYLIDMARGFRSAYWDKDKIEE